MCPRLQFRLANIDFVASTASSSLVVLTCGIHFCGIDAGVECDGQVTAFDKRR